MGRKIKVDEGARNCPFCGYGLLEFWFDKGCKSQFVHCPWCAAQGPMVKEVCYDFPWDDMDEDEFNKLAIELWNGDIERVDNGK